MIQNFHVRLAAGFLAIVVALVAVAALSYRTAQNLVTASVWVAHTDEVIAELEATRNSMAELGPEQSLSENGDFREHIFHLERLTSDNSRQHEHLLKSSTIKMERPTTRRSRDRRLRLEFWEPFTSRSNHGLGTTSTLVTAGSVNSTRRDRTSPTLRNQIIRSQVSSMDRSAKKCMS